MRRWLRGGGFDREGACEKWVLATRRSSAIIWMYYRDKMPDDELKEGVRVRMHACSLFDSRPESVGGGDGADDDKTLVSAARKVKWRQCNDLCPWLFPKCT